MSSDRGSPTGDATGAEPVPALDHYPNGNVRYRGYPLGGELHGAWIFYRTDGSLVLAGTFDGGGHGTGGIARAGTRS